ncbi:MAG: hypothetical protein ABL879_13035 [Devosia sp.]
MNTIGTDLFVIIGGGVAGGLIVWTLVDGLKTGKLPLKYGGMVHRSRQPLGFWFVTVVSMALLAVVGFGIGAAVLDLFNR